jgi:hypothetical protein
MKTYTAWRSSSKHYNFYLHDGFHSEYRGKASITIVGDSESFVPWARADKMARAIAEQLGATKLGHRERMITAVSNSGVPVKMYRYEVLDDKIRWDVSAYRGCGYVISGIE